MFSPNPKLTSLIVGSGAVQHSWEPILRVLQLPSLTAKITKEGANTLLANIVYKRRFWYNMDSPALKEISERTMFNAKTAICKEVHDAEKSGELKEWNSFDTILDSIVLTDTNALDVISTNWDYVIDEAVKRKLHSLTRKINLRVYHIHGATKAPSLLYLPTEVIHEPYREEKEINILGSMQADVMTRLKVAQKVIIYGLSISALDAELLQLLYSSLDGDYLKEILILNPEHESVAEKLNLLRDRTKGIMLIGVDPNDLSNRIIY